METTDPHLGQLGLRMHGTSCIARGIETVTNSHTHHVVVGIGGGMVASAEPGTGVVLRPETDFPDFVWSRFDYTDEQRLAVAEHARLAEGTPYNYAAFVAMGFFGIIHQPVPGWISAPIARNHRVDCSQLAVEALAEATPSHAVPSWTVTPGDLERLFVRNGWPLTPTPTKALEPAN